MNPLLIEGLTDAIGFIGGVLLAYWIGKLFGIDPLAAGYDAGAVMGIVLCGVGGGVGLQLARRWRATRAKKKE